MKSHSLTFAVVASALLLGPVAAQDTTVKAWLGRTVVPNAGETVQHYVWGATSVSVDEYRIAAEDLDAALRESAVVINRSTARPRRTLTFQGEQGAVTLPNLPGVYVYVARSTAGQPGEMAQAVVVSRLSLAVKRDDSRSLVLVHEGERARVRRGEPRQPAQRQVDLRHVPHAPVIPHPLQECGRQLDRIEQPQQRAARRSGQPRK